MMVSSMLSSSVGVSNRDDDSLCEKYLPSGNNDVEMQNALSLKRSPEREDDNRRPTQLSRVNSPVKTMHSLEPVAKKVKPMKHMHSLEPVAKKVKPTEDLVQRVCSATTSRRCNIPRMLTDEKRDALNVVLFGDYVSFTDRTGKEALFKHSQSNVVLRPLCMYSGRDGNRSVCVFMISTSDVVNSGLKDDEIKDPSSEKFDSGKYWKVSGRPWSMKRKYIAPHEIAKRVSELTGRKLDLAKEDLIIETDFGSIAVIAVERFKENNYEYRKKLHLREVVALHVIKRFLLRMRLRGRFRSTGSLGKILHSHYSALTGEKYSAASEVFNDMNVAVAASMFLNRIAYKCHSSPGVTYTCHTSPYSESFNGRVFLFAYLASKNPSVVFDDFGDEEVRLYCMAKKVLAVFEEIFPGMKKDTNTELLESLFPDARRVDSRRARDLTHLVSHMVIHFRRWKCTREMKTAAALFFQILDRKEKCRDLEIINGTSVQLVEEEYHVCRSLVCDKDLKIVLGEIKTKQNEILKLYARVQDGNAFFISNVHRYSSPKSNLLENASSSELKYALLVDNKFKLNPQGMALCAVVSYEHSVPPYDWLFWEELSGDISEYRYTRITKVLNDTVERMEMYEMGPEGKSATMIGLSMSTTKMEKFRALIQVLGRDIQNAIADINKNVMLACKHRKSFNEVAVIGLNKTMDKIAEGFSKNVLTRWRIQKVEQPMGFSTSCTDAIRNALEFVVNAVQELRVDKFNRVLEVMRVELQSVETRCTLSQSTDSEHRTYIDSFVEQGVLPEKIYHDSRILVHMNGVFHTFVTCVIITHTVQVMSMLYINDPSVRRSLLLAVEKILITWPPTAKQSSFTVVLVMNYVQKCMSLYQTARVQRELIENLGIESEERMKQTKFVQNLWTMATSPDYDYASSMPQEVRFLMSQLIENVGLIKRFVIANKRYCFLSSSA
jgi:hypothetical protein